LFSLVRLDWLNGQQLLGQAEKPPTRRNGTQQLFANESAETKNGSARRILAWKVRAFTERAAHCHGGWR
jgi:hypothetical protein